MFFSSSVYIKCLYFWKKGELKWVMNFLKVKLKMKMGMYVFLLMIMNVNGDIFLVICSFIIIEMKNKYLVICL